MEGEQTTAFGSVTPETRRREFPDGKVLCSKCGYYVHIDNFKKHRASQCNAFRAGRPVYYRKEK